MNKTKIVSHLFPVRHPSRVFRFHQSLQESIRNSLHEKITPNPNGRTLTNNTSNIPPHLTQDYFFTKDQGNSGLRHSDSQN